jgi:hypothetical protein
MHKDDFRRVLDEYKTNKWPEDYHSPNKSTYTFRKVKTLEAQVAAKGHDNESSEMDLELPGNTGS